MELTTFFTKKNILITASIFVIGLVIIAESKPANANECPYSNFMVVDGKCINLDPQMKIEKKSKISNPISELDNLTGSSMATYASLLSLVGGTAAGYKFLVRK